MATIFSQGKRFYENIEVEEQQGDTTNTHFAFPRQCLVLGDPRVGKTSLVKSLTGRPFDPAEQRTQGIDQSLVDHKWKNCDMKDLVFGDLWRYLKTGDVQVALIGTGRQNNKVLVKDREFIMTTSLLRLYLYFGGIVLTFLFIIGTVYRYPVAYLLFYYIYHGYLMFPICVNLFESHDIRLTLATVAFILNRRGLLIGLYSAIMICPFYNSYLEFASTRQFLMLSTVAGIAFVVLFLFIGPQRLPFGTGRLIKNQTLMKFLCFCRLPLSILIGLISGFIVAMSLWRLQGLCYREHTSIELSVTSMSHVIKDARTFAKLTACVESTDKIVISFLALFVVDFPLNIYDTKYVSTVIIPAIKKDRSLGPVPQIALLIVWTYYHIKVAYQAHTTPRIAIYFFFITFPAYVGLTFYQELFCSNSDGSETQFVNPFNSFMTLALIGNGEINTKMIQTALNKKYPFLKMKILDFAGDEEYYAYHHMFLKNQAVYVVVFNMSDFALEEFQNLKAERLLVWFESVCGHVQPKTPIFLVGTHCEHIDKNHMQNLNSKLKQILWTSYCDELVVNEDEDLIFFPVENSKGENDVGVQMLRIKIMAAAEECKSTTDDKIPLSWIRIQDAIIQLRQRKVARYCVTLREFPWAFGNIIHTNWSEETLKYFHEQGLIIYIAKDKDLSDWVLLKPEILVDIITKLVTSSPQMTQTRGLRSDWRLLQEKGLLTKPLLISIISNVKENEEAMSAFLEKYDLICPLTNTKVKIVTLRDKERLQPTHFVPSLLPKSQDGCNPAWYDDKRDKKFLVFFERFLPEPLFHRLLSRAHKKSKVEFANGATVVFRDVGKFWMSSRQPYRLKLMKKEGVIEVTFSTR